MEPIKIDAKTITLTKSVAKNNTKMKELWPQVQVGLELLSAMVKNSFVKSIISVVLAAGNAIVAQIK